MSTSAPYTQHPCQEPVKATVIKANHDLQSNSTFVTLGKRARDPSFDENIDCEVPAITSEN